MRIRLFNPGWVTHQSLFRSTDCAATAAAQAIDTGVSVQKVDYAKLREQLLKDGQVLEWHSEPQPK